MKQLSLWVIIFCASIMLYTNYTLKLYNNPNRIIESDVKHYYAWIPAVFVYKDISLGFLDKNPDSNSGYFFTVDRYEGHLFFKTTMGVAIMQSIFVLPVHYYLKSIGGVADGFSPPYKIALILSSCVYFILTLLILRYFLIKRMKTSEIVAALTLLIIGLGTNIVHYVIREPAMSHVYSFFTIGLLIFLVDKLFTKPTWFGGLLVGIAFALVTLIRPVNSIIGIIFLAWGVTSFDDLRERIIFFIKKPEITFAIIASFILMWVPQFLYYKFLTGKYEFVGYGSGGEFFFFNNPQILNNLFSFRKGWFLYTPLMLLAVFGLIPLYKNYRNYFWTTAITLTLLIYINSSWYSWWFGGGYGQRAYIDIYMLMAFPIAAFLSKVLSQKIFIKACSITIIILLILFNCFQVIQYYNGAIHYIGMTQQAYFKSFGKIKAPYGFDQYIDVPDMELAKKGIYPKFKKKNFTKEFWLKYIEQGFRNSPEYMELLSKKAILNQEPLDTVIKHDANYIYHLEFEK